MDFVARVQEWTVKTIMYEYKKHKSISKKKRLIVYEKCNHRCAYCGCELEYKDMQIDHIIALNSGIIMEDEESDNIKNLLPACRQCNFYKQTFTVEQFRQRIQETMINNLRKQFIYKLAVKYGLIEEHNKPITFYFERVEHND